MAKLSIIILAKDEIKYFPQAISSAQDLADEVVVVLDEPFDKEIELTAKRLKANVYYRKLDSFSKQKQYAMERAKNEWVFFLDSDEVIENGLKQEIQAKLENPVADAYFVPRKNILFGKWIKHGDYFPDYQMKLFKKSQAKFSQPVHEVVTINSQKIAHLTNSLLHYNYQDIKTVLERQNLYTEFEAQRLIDSGRKFSYFYLIFKPFKEFFWRYIVKGGIFDGSHGFIVATLGAQYRFITALKIWQISKKSAEVKKNEKNKKLN